MAYFKETKSATMNIFRKIFFSKNGVFKVELSHVISINLFTIAENCMEKQIIKTGVFSLVGYYLRPSNNYRRLIFNINAVVLILIIC